MIIAHLTPAIPLPACRGKCGHMKCFSSILLMYCKQCYVAVHIHFLQRTRIHPCSLQIDSTDHSHTLSRTPTWTKPSLTVNAHR